MPIKISIFMWRFLKGRISTDDNLRRMHINIVSICWCCEDYQQETMSHLFLTSPIAARLWRQFALCAGIAMEGMQLSQVLITWWNTATTPKLKPVLRVIPSFIVRELWKRRNSIRHGKDISYSRLTYQIHHLIYQFIRVRFPWMNSFPTARTEMIRILSTYIPKLYYAKITWALPPTGRLKVNTDGASRGNPGRSSYSFCLRDERGNLVFAQAQEIHSTTNIEAETKVVLEAMKYCKTGNLHNVIIETDSLGIMKMIQKQWKPPWEIADMIEEIQQNMQITQAQIRHTHGEGNQLANFIVNHALNNEGRLQFFTFADIPIQARKILNSDKSQIPNLRIKTKRINLEINSNLQNHK